MLIPQAYIFPQVKNTEISNLSAVQNILPRQQIFLS